ncbi:nucleolar MIF4G domain-containing protein 1 homolog [Anopheles aquasalis]|uniref:nucleolar MIF4G domain-containing protein 1 homolog n=1 Tax=Anopheles aquasalis TaxID=42839 RepID=UPI00215B2B8B|nr:nucleolar MIF4G domain-containing protein 1 homolog [Anopheles aquasalis]
MKIRPQKNVRQGLVGGRGRGRGRVNQPKSRKELRKEKRQQKKINRFNYHNRSRKERYESAAGGGRDKGGGKKAGQHADSEDEEFPDNDVEDEEIDSDLCSGGEEDEEGQQKQQQQGQQGQQRSKSALLTNQLDVEREKEMMELRQYEESLKKKRIDQLEAANEEDDRIIKKYEKLLHINRRKNKEGVPKSFDDGLDYALELCTDDSIRKMYEAAKEAAELEENSSDEFVEDLQQAVGAESGVTTATNGKSSSSGEPDGVAGTGGKLSQKERRRVEKLRKMEEKHLGLDEFDDLGDYDSELDIEGDEEQDGDMDSDYSESDELYSGTDDDDDDEGSSEGEDGQDNQRKRKVQFAADSKQTKNGKKRKTAAYDSEEDEMSEQDEEAEKETGAGRFVLLNPSKKKANSAVKAKKSKKSTESEEDAESDDDTEEGDDGLDDLLDGLESDGSFEEDGGSETDNGDDGKDTNGDGTWEDIYGRKRDKAGNVIKEETVGTPGTAGGKYVPPHLRAKQEAQSSASDDPKRQEKLLRLKRQLKGQVNRLAEANVHRISIELDNLYMQNARFDMNSTLTSLLLEALVPPTLTPERMVLEHMLLVAILHANVGSEVGSHFLETVVERFFALLQTIATDENEAKQLDNCVQILCHLYTFDIVKGKLVYEMLQKLLECFNEKAVECILLVLRTIGFILRKDDPLALKDLIVAIQKKAANAPEELRKDPRVKFMLETLMAVKNNNMHKIPAYDPTLVEHFRKLLKGMITSGKYVSTMNIGLDDIVNIPERGKWWLVGSAWHGAPSTIGGKTPDAAGRDGAAGGQFSEQLLELARQQRMNTDDRRNVFCIVMSAEDYLDAFEKLLRLAIKDLRIVVSVIMHCSLAEKEYNPYYSVLSQKFCDYDRRYQLAIQFALWDRLKEVHSLKPQQLRNLARFITHLIGEGGLPLSCLKVVDFADLDKVSLRLMRQVMLGLLLPVEENKCLQVFSRIVASYKLKAFKDSLRLFMHHFLARGSASHKQLPEDQVQLLQQRIKQADQLLATEDSRIQFDDE